MSQHDYNIANQTGLEFRQDLNNALEAIVTQNSGATAPTDTFPGMKWLDTSTNPPVEKRRNQANNAWETTLTEAGRILCAAADAAAQRTAMGAQATLVSGTNIKTINGESVLGSGDINVADAFKGANQSLSANGYQRLPGGLIIQWGHIEGSQVSLAASYPIAFPNAVIGLAITLADKTAGAIAGLTLFSNGSLNTKSQVGASLVGYDTGIWSFRYIAIGY